MTRRSGLWLLLIVATAAAFRFVGLAWGAPYFHFHIDEHFVMQGADYLRSGFASHEPPPKFFMYGALPMWMLDAVRWVWELFFGVLNLTIDRDEVTYMVMGRAISAALGTLTVLVVYAIATRLAGRTAALIAAFLLAASVVHLRESHFFSVDITMVLFCALAWWFAQRIAERARLRDYVWAGVMAGGAIACKFSALFVFGVIGVAHLMTLAMNRPRDAREWLQWIGRGVTPILVALAVFVAVNPMALMYWARFRQDMKDWVIDIGSGARPVIFTSQFADLAHPKLYWFTNLLWWGLGPLFEAAGLVGVLWLLLRRDRHALVAASFPVFYYIAASQTNAPHIRYAAPLAVGLAVAAGVFWAELMTRSRGRVIATVLMVATCVTTGLYATAYMNVFTSPDVRLVASKWLVRNVPEGSRILVEPSQNVVPMGDYRRHVDFTKSYVPFASDLEGHWDRRDYYDMHALDTYRYLYNPGVEDQVRKRTEYIGGRLALADWIVMDDTYVQFYDHLPEETHGVTKQYYRELFGGKLGFKMVQTFKEYPKLFGVEINDDAAELSFRLFDHPRIFVFKRQ